MKFIFRFSAFIAFALFMFFACKKGDEQCVGGTGGNVELNVYLQHDTHAVVNLKNYRDTIYIKYNTKEYPGPNLSGYDAVVIGDWPGDFVRVTGLKCGDYFIYGAGYESVHGYRVSGGIPCSIGQTEGKLSMTIPVTQ